MRQSACQFTEDSASLRQNAPKCAEYDRSTRKCNHQQARDIEPHDKMKKAKAAASKKAAPAKKPASAKAKPAKKPPVAKKKAPAKAPSKTSAPKAKAAKPVKSAKAAPPPKPVKVVTLLLLLHRSRSQWSSPCGGQASAAGPCAVADCCQATCPCSCRQASPSCAACPTAEAGQSRAAAQAPEDWQGHPDCRVGERSRIRPQAGEALRSHPLPRPAASASEWRRREACRLRARHAQVFATGTSPTPCGARATSGNLIFPKRHSGMTA